MLDTNLAVSFGGGEPTLLSNLEEYISFEVENGWRQILNTSALLYKDYVKDALANQKFSLQVSVDSGTFEVYKKVKGQSGYNIVWENIRKYCESKGKVFVKYIIFSYNSAKEEVDAFIEMCEQVGVDNVCISAEANAVWDLKKELPWE